MSEFTVRLFGAFRDVNPNSVLSLKVDVPVSVNILKEKLSYAIKENAISAKREELSDLVFDSALATDEVVLDSNEILQEGCTLALLPPVCGG